METFNFLENAEDSDEEEDEDGDLMDEISPNKHHRNKKHKSKVQGAPLDSFPHRLGPFLHPAAVLRWATKVWRQRTTPTPRRP